jgi:hypothetical protein
MTGNSTAELKYIRESAQYNYDSTKIYSEELMSLADQNIKLIKENIKNDANININKIKSYIAAIGMESDQIESLGWVLTQQKNKHKRNLQGLFDLILDWLDSIEQSVEQTDADTKYIYDLVMKLNANTLIGEIMLKAENTMTSLRKINMKATVMADSEELKRIEDALDLGKWNNYMDEFKNNLKSSIKENQKNKGSSSASIGFWVLIMVGVIGLGGFVYLYIRLQKAISNNAV